MKFIKTIIYFIYSVFAISVFAQEEVIIDRVVASLGDNIILQSDVENYIIQQKSQGITVDNQTKCNALEEKLYQKLLVAQSEVDSVTVSESQVESEFNLRMRYFIEQFGSEKAMEDFYGKSILEIKEEFKDLIRDQLIARTMEHKITGDLKVSPSEVREFYNNIHKDSLPFINSEVEVAHILVNARISPEAKKEALDRIEKYRERIMKGEKMSTLALLYSEDPGSAKNRGELGFLSRSDLVTEFSAVAFKLKEGEISKVVETEYGYHIIELIERRGEKINVRHILVSPKIRAEDLQQAKVRADSIAALIEQDSLSFEEAALLFSDDEESRNNGGLLMNQYSGTSLFEMDQLNTSIFLVIDKMAAGDISEAVPTRGGVSKQGYELVYLKKRTEPHRPSLQDDYQRIQTLALSDKENREIDNWIREKIVTFSVDIKTGFEDCSFKRPWIRKENQ